MRPLVLAAALLATGPALGQGADVLLNCSACHTVGPAREGAVPSPFPNLNGQPARYLARQLEAYREGLRQHPQMQATAIALGQGAGAMARLYADAPVPDLSGTGAAGDFPEAERLVAEGDWDRGLPPCASCHALDPDERGRLMPRLHGHPAPYLARQLRAYASGERRSDTMGRMRAFAAELTEAEIDALAAYYAPRPPGAADDRTEDTPDG